MSSRASGASRGICTLVSRRDAENCPRRRGRPRDAPRAGPPSSPPRPQHDFVGSGRRDHSAWLCVSAGRGASGPYRRDPLRLCVKRLREGVPRPASTCSGCCPRAPREITEHKSSTLSDHSAFRWGLVVLGEAATDSLRSLRGDTHPLAMACPAELELQSSKVRADTHSRTYQ